MNDVAQSMSRHIAELEVENAALNVRQAELEATLTDLASPDFMVKYRKLERDAARLAEWDKAADFYRRCKVDPRSHEVGAMRDAVEWLCSIAARAADSADDGLRQLQRESEDLGLYGPQSAHQHWPGQVQCEWCKGTGAIDAPTSADDPTCPNCDGEGRWAKLQT